MMPVFSPTSSIPADGGARLPCSLREELALAPFTPGDISVGVENELQAAVQGTQEDVDLVRSIRESTYFQNLVKRGLRGDLPRSRSRELLEFLNANREQVWENSWVRLPRRLLSPLAASTFDHDLLADKGRPAGPCRGDCDRFQFFLHGEPWLRVPVSYLLRLALADVLGSSPGISPDIARLGRRLLDNFVSDNTSPEILSFYVSTDHNGLSAGQATARETARRFLLLQLLVQYANERLGLKQHGQTCLLYAAPCPPQRQKQLNELVSDAMYRELFMNPCLAGWDRGEDKFRYMELCHSTLSRSQLHTLAMLREAGIIANNLVVLPNTSNTSLANNGTHISLGSPRLNQLAREGGLPPSREKWLGDLVIKIVEHFLPLFVGTVSAAPQRIAFEDFHSERLLAFLPHELDYTHLRMLWRWWKKKADIKRFGHVFTPYGPPAMDRWLGRMLGLRGDYVPDLRLLDYLVALLGTEDSPALDGRPGNHQRLKRDLAAMGIFDPSMAIYLPYRQREYGKTGYCGFEGRLYSQFPSLLDDMPRAVHLQQAITALAWHWAVRGTITHADIPDDPSSESERRQFLFATAIGIPTLYIRSQSGNRLMQRIVARIPECRHSRRYRGYTRVPNQAYQRASLELLRKEGAWLLEDPHLRESCLWLADALDAGRRPAEETLTAGILGRGGDPLRLEAGEFNQAAEGWYRNTLRQRYLREGLAVLRLDALTLEREADQGTRRRLAELTGGISAGSFVARLGRQALTERLDPEQARRLILLGLLVLERETKQYDHIAETTAAVLSLHPDATPSPLAAPLIHGDPVA
ncbi:MAG: hypothetical protein BWK76_17730 [Desulfobulbaceae bacterium A2]|nr:MAG: hypothetical protein BWK76_17730 [Desulfobulbaceae bacterium A2]